MVHQFAEAMKRHSFVLRLLMLIALGASLNACMVANYQITAQEPKEGRANLASKDDEPMSFVIPWYYRPLNCGVFSGGWDCENQRDFQGVQIYKGVSATLVDVPLEKPAEFTEHIRSKGLVCVVTVNEQLNPYTPYINLLSALTMFVVPAYTTQKYVLSYTLLRDFKTVKESEFHITEKVISGYISWLLIPVVYPLWRDIEIAIDSSQKYVRGPLAGVVKETMRTFLLEARRDGIL